MSGFGLRTLKKKSDNENKEKKRTYVKHLVFGENLASVLTFQKLYEQHPADVKMLTRNPYSTADIHHDLKCSMQPIRSEEVANKLIGMYPQLEIFKKNEDVYFYKDTKFHKFGGRAKSHDLKEEEKFYQEPFYNYRPENLIHLTDEVFEQFQLNKIINSIDLQAPTDLLEKTNFRLTTGDDEIIDCEYLYFCETPKRFFSMITKKNDVPDSIAEYIAPLVNYRAITVYFECSGEVYEPASSMIIPQSMTHEWGSFVLDFEEYDASTNTQNIKALSFIDEDIMQEEELAKKIRHMQKVIERVIPEFGKVEVSQTIKYSEEFYTDGINDELAPKLGEFPVKFIGTAAPIQMENSKDFQYLPRTLASLESLNI
ncbi:MAG: hypothetical protein CME62_14290 [Halobacteriovoraceae bacterium]|nr:hypothetical protein [Halobacteriovoraceae bacterium]